MTSYRQLFSLEGSNQYSDKASISTLASRKFARMVKPNFPAPIIASSYQPIRQLNQATCMMEDLRGIPSTRTNDGLALSWKENQEASTKSPSVWGPPLWFSIHNGANYYPDEPTHAQIHNMIGYIRGLPEMLPCKRPCAEHARKYIHDNLDNLHDVCSSRLKLFNFFVDFHNYVNERQGKHIMTYDEAYKLYNNQASVSVFTYK